MEKYINLGDYNILLEIIYDLWANLIRLITKRESYDVTHQSIALDQKYG